MADLGEAMIDSTHGHGRCVISGNL